MTVGGRPAHRHVITSDSVVISVGATRIAIILEALITKVYIIRYFGGMAIRGGCVYIMTNKANTVVYIGVTSDIIARVWQHKNKVYPISFTAKYNCNKLVYFVFYPDIEEAIAAEKQLKDRSRTYKNKLISEMNPDWKDLYASLLNE